MLITEIVLSFEMNSVAKNAIWTEFYPHWGTEVHGSVNDPARYKRAAICNLWRFCHQPKATFNKATFQQDRECDNSLLVHVEKHPEIVQLGRQLFPHTTLSDVRVYLSTMRYLARYLLKKILREGYICKISTQNAQKNAFHFEYDGAEYTLVVETHWSGNKYLNTVNGVTCFRRDARSR